LQQKYLREYLPNISIGNQMHNERIKKIDFSGVFGSDCPVWLEVGFGGGEHLLSLAKRNRNVGLLGCEPYLNGVAKLLPKLIDSEITNVRIFMDDARKIFEMIPNSKISKIFLLFPDPWPKLRHHRRRFVNLENIELMAKILQPGGLLYLATDVKDYVRHSLELLMNTQYFHWLADKPSDWREPWLNWSPTRYQVKTQKLGRATNYMVFQRK
jgi:tRNA (guanine-N7-)-methyltransferase